MAGIASTLPTSVRRRYERERPDARMIRAPVVVNISDYFELLTPFLSEKGSPLWFRGHADYHWDLTPSALRTGDESDRNSVLGLLADFKRMAQTKHPSPPDADKELEWMQLAQHYGLPTRLLDWTQNAAIALYFACLEPKKDGLVFLFNPVDLNRETDPRRPRVFDAHLDRELIGRYFNLTGARDPRGPKTIAIHPTWNSQRIMLQQGAFTLHGSREFALTKRQAPSLVYLPIRKHHKETLRVQLERVGISEMSIFPELEHLCSQLKRGANILS